MTITANAQGKTIIKIELNWFKDFKNWFLLKQAIKITHQEEIFKNAQGNNIKVLGMLTNV